jgi:hypothetical protein
MKKKAALELSMNFIVGLILGIILFSFGLVFAYKLLAQSKEVIDTGIPDICKIEEQNCVNQQKKLCIPEITKEIQTAKADSFCAIINNIYGKKKEFKINVQFAKGILEDGSESSWQDATVWTKKDYPPDSIENNLHISLGLPFRVPGGTKAGTYVFNVNICIDSNDNVQQGKCPTSHPSLYTNTQQVSIIVP